MSVWQEDVEEALDAFARVSQLAGDPIGRSDLTVQFLPAPHRAPSSMPAGTMAVYGFWADGRWLKIGKAGPHSGPRYVSHHYNLSAPSTLAKSLAADPAMRGVAGFDPAAPGGWIREATNRVNILMPAARDPMLLALLEMFLHVRLRPRYEG
jgi:hypothetical protein